MESATPTHSQNPRCVPLARGRDLFAEMIRHLQEKGGIDEPNFFNSTIEGTALGFTVDAFGANVQGYITGERAVGESCGLGVDGRNRLARRGWALPGDEEGDDLTATQSWKGVTSKADRHHLAEEMISIATDIYGIPKDREIRFQVQ